mgnify:CR=1 FL=1
MHMTIGQMAREAGVSTRTLRHYEEQGLLAPQRTDAGYRVYDEADARRLAQVLALRSCHLPLATIRRLMHRPGRHAPRASSRSRIAGSVIGRGNRKDEGRTDNHREDEGHEHERQLRDDEGAGTARF